MFFVVVEELCLLFINLLKLKVIELGRSLNKSETFGKTGTLAGMPIVGPRKGKSTSPEVSNNTTLWTASCF